jgi:hypothetical protein
MSVKFRGELWSKSKFVVDVIAQVWGLTMRHLKNMRRLGKALPQAVYLMLACMPATGFIESHFSKLQVLAGQRRAGTSLKQLRAQMKIMLDGPDPGSFVACKPQPFGACLYQASPLCLKAQHKYVELFGSKDFTTSDARKDSGDKPVVPNSHKGLPQKSREGSKRHALSSQYGELRSAMASCSPPSTETVPNPPMHVHGDSAISGHAIDAGVPGLKVAEVRVETKASQAQRWTDKQDKMLAQHEITKGRKRQLIESDLKPMGEDAERVNKLKKMREEASVRAAGKVVVSRTPSQSTRLVGDAGEVLLWLPTGRNQLSTPLVAFGLPKGAVYIGLDGLARMIRQPTGNKLWFVVRQLSGIVSLNVGDSTTTVEAEELILPGLAARLFGGALVDDVWVRACQKAAMMVEPLLRLAPAAGEHRELWIHREIHVQMEWFYKLLWLTMPANSNNICKWVLRRERTDIKNSRLGIALFPKRRLDEARAREAELSAAVEAGTAGKDVLLPFRGQAMCIDEFAQMMATFR